jgi:1-phosphofructokinase family hexose kinase
LIVTLTMNPAIDRTLTVDRLAIEDRAYIRSSHETPGGRGINASHVIHSFGGRTLAIAPSGGATGERLERLLAQSGFAFAPVPIQNDIRTNLTVTDRHGVTVSLNEAGPHISRREVEQVENLVREKAAKAKWVLLCGSLPPGAPHDLYARMIAVCKRHNVPVLLDTDGEALREALEAHPTVLAPNQQEAERLLSRALLTRTHFLDAAAGIRALGAENVVLSLGSRGAVGAFADGRMVEALPPQVDAVCAIGAGDALVAAFTWSMVRGSDRNDALRWGVAAGTASAKLPGIRFASLEQATEIYQKVELRQVD